MRLDAEAKNLSHGNQWLIDAFKFAAHTGARRAELCNLRWESVDEENQLVHIQNTGGFSTKSGRERTIPLAGMALEVIQWKLEKTPESDATDYVFAGANGGQLNDEYLTTRFRFYRKHVNLPKNISLHSLRHTFASWFVQKGGDLYRLKEIMGHADIDTTQKYAYLRPDALREEMNKCFGDQTSIENVPSQAELEAEIQELQAELKEKRSRLEEMEAEE